MNIRDLHYLVLLAECRSFRKAADSAFVTQPTLSSQIRKLEEELGVILFERNSRNVMPTPVGEMMVAEAKKILMHVTVMKDTAAIHKDPLAGDLRLGVIASLSPYFTPQLLEQFSYDAPRLQLLATEGLTNLLLDELNNHRLDAVILATSVNDKNLISMDLFTEPFFLAHSKNHILSRKKHITLHDIKTQPLLLLEEGHCLREQALELCMAGQMDERVKATSLTTLLRLAELNQGITLIPALAAHEARNLSLRPLKGAQAKRKIRLVTRRQFPRIEALKVIETAARSFAKKNGLLL